MQEIIQAYAKREGVYQLDLGGIVYNNEVQLNTATNLVLKSFNRHGLIAGATGTGKTKTIQVLAEQLSLAGVPSLVMDMKGDLSGLAMPGEANPHLTERCTALGLACTFRGFPVELLRIDERDVGIPLHATVVDFGPLLFSRILELNETQTSVLTILFSFAKDGKIPLTRLDDLKTIIQYIQTDTGRMQIEQEFGVISAATLSIILRKIIELQAQGADSFFAEPAFTIQDLFRTNPDGLGIISILRLASMQDKPKLFSTFMLKLLSDVYQKMPEIGDPEKPRLVIFIDEAHLIFNQASKSLVQFIETIVKLIRSKGIGLFFSTQSPTDISESVLSQLGLKIQHALRAFTAKDRKAMKLVAQNFPPSTVYNTEQLLTSLGMGEALITALDEKGQPLPLMECMIRPPQSRMGVLSGTEIEALLNQSPLKAKYAQINQTPSAAEVLSQNKVPEKKQEKIKKTNDESLVHQLSKNTLFRQIVRQVFRQVTDQLLKILGIKRSR